MFQKTCFQVLLGVMILNAAGPAMAHQPQAIDLHYDWSQQVLSITVKHTSDDKLRHYIRRIEVFNNDQSIHAENFFRQVNKTQIKLDVPLAAKDADVVRVKAFCKEGGALEETLTINKPDETANTTGATPASSTNAASETSK